MNSTASVVILLDRLPNNSVGRAALVGGNQVSKVIHLVTTLGCPPAVAFAHFTRPEKLTEWLSEAAEVKAEVGGEYELFWEPDRRDRNSTLGCRVTAVTPDQLLAFEWKSPAQFAAFANAADPLTHVVVALVPVGGSTVAHLTHTGWRSTADWEEARAWQECAWRMALDTLAKLLPPL